MGKKKTPPCGGRGNYAGVDKGELHPKPPSLTTANFILKSQPSRATKLIVIQLSSLMGKYNLENTNLKTQEVSKTKSLFVSYRKNKSIL